jgi:hypothetical protein
VKILIAVALAFSLAVGASGALAAGGPHEARSHPTSGEPCGWTKGSLPDPAETQRCLASRYKPPKPKPAAPTPSQPAANDAQGE